MGGQQLRLGHPQADVVVGQHLDGMAEGRFAAGMPDLQPAQMRTRGKIAGQDGIRNVHARAAAQRHALDPRAPDDLAVHLNAHRQPAAKPAADVRRLQRPQRRRPPADQPGPGKLVVPARLHVKAVDSVHAATVLSYQG